MNSYNHITHHQLFRDIDMPFNLKNFREMSWTVQNSTNYQGAASRGCEARQPNKAVRETSEAEWILIVM